jgi:hypothetical protein
MDLAPLELPHNPAPACAPPTPVVVHVFGDNGFVWDALGAHPTWVCNAPRRAAT